MDIRARKPWLRFLFSLLGWYVRFMVLILGRKFRGQIGWPDGKEREDYAGQCPVSILFASVDKWVGAV